MTSRRAPLPRPKRAGEEFARTHDFASSSSDANPAFNKKPRFDVRNPSALAPDALEDDAFLEADEIGKRGLGTKRNAVQVDGYGSDSSNEGFNARAEAKAKGAKKTKGAASKDEEEDDMFADLEPGDGDEDEEVTAQGKSKGKNVRFLGEDEIEGQVAGSRSGGHVSADFSVGAASGGASRNGIADRMRGSGNVEDNDSDESNVDEEERADVGDVDEEIGAGGKKSHAPKLDAFNMKNEQEEGRFDDQGNFVRKAADADAVHDSWLEGVSKKDMKKAKEAADKRDDEQRQKQREDDALLTSDILNTLIRHLHKTETVLEALARLGKGKGKTKAKKVPKWKKSIQKPNKLQDEHADDDNNDDMDVDIDKKKPAEDPAETRRKAAVEAITGAADQLYTRGQAEIYETERESLIRQYTRETGGEQWVDDDPPANHKNSNGVSSSAVDEGSQSMKKWEYRWSDARDGGEAHGPYDGATMVQWNDAGYFGDGVEFREIAQTTSTTAGAGVGYAGWSRVVDFV